MQTTLGQAIRVVLADDHDLVRSGIKALLGMIDGLNAHALVRWEDAADRGSRIGHAVEGMLGLGRGALAASAG